MSSNKVIRIKGTRYTTVDRYDPALKVKAFELFMHTDRDLLDIATELEVGREVIASWVREGGWVKRRKDAEQELMKAADDKFQAFVMENKLPTIRRHARISGKLEEAIEQVIDGEIKRAEKADKPLDDKLLKRMADALAAVTAVSGRAVGLADAIVQKGAPMGGRVPLVAIGMFPRIPADRTGDGQTITINGSSEELP